LRHREEILKTTSEYAASHKTQRRARRVRNRDRINTQNRTWSRANPDKVRECNRREYLKNKSARNIRSKRYYEANKARLIAWQIAWAANHPDKVKKAKTEWKKRNPDIDLAHANARRARILNVTFDDSAKQFYVWVRAQKEVECFYCGEMLPSSECHIDHKVAISRGGSHVASNLCVSCPPCNQSKGNKTLEEWKGEIHVSG
jgi:5-methylcytosine-specific restriction endonuclease McrA